MDQNSLFMKKSILFRNIVFLNVLAALVFLGVMAYLGTFARYMADDYCESLNMSTDSPLEVVINRYVDGTWRASNRYSNLLFVGVVERLVPNNIEVISPVMIALWAIGLIAAVYEIRTFVGARWPMLVDLYLGTLLAFLSLFEAPNRFQILYWRSSMATHFAPLVFLNFLLAFLFLCLRLAKGRSVPIWIGFTFFLVSFLIGGFSEPPVTLIILGAGTSLLYGWFFAKGESRRPALTLFTWILAGGILALSVMALSPAMSGLDHSPSFLEWIQSTAQYTYYFVFDTLKTLPVPTLFGFGAPVILFYFLFQEQAYSQLVDLRGQQNTFRLLLAAPLLLVVFIAAGFSTSAFGQSYPVDRARFFAAFLMIAVFMFEGMLVGIWLSRVRLSALRFSYLPDISILVLLIAACYPFRAALNAYQDLPAYRERAELWDLRDAYFIRHASAGELDIVAPGFSGVDGVKELDDSERHWVNKCAAAYYGVNTIRVLSIPDEFLQEVLREN